jgi:putative ABC transport system ATP-binding protein
MIDLKNIRKIYTGNTVETIALNNLSLKVEKSDFVAIVGKSGSGKSTLLNILGCMDTFDSGSYIFEGTDVKKLDYKQRAIFRSKKIGFVFQSFHLVHNMKVIENVEMPLGYAGIGTKKRKALAFSILERLGIEGKSNNYPSQLSGGQQQRVAIARALINNPSLLLADEPTGNLDTKTSEEIINLFEEINKQGSTVIIVTHDPIVANRAKIKINVEDGHIV